MKAVAVVERREAEGARGSGRRFGIALTALLALSGCSVRKLAVNKVADVLAEPGTVWSSDDDPELVGDALPFALKTQESLLAASPDHVPLLVATCKGFVSYAAGWIEAEADRVEPDEYGRALALRGRALRLYLRARGYCLHALELGFRVDRAPLVASPREALSRVTKPGVELLYWTGAAWGAAIGVGTDRPELIGDLPVVRALFERALELDEAFDAGALHEAMIALDAQSESLGGSRARAEQHYRRAVELSGGRRASPHVAWAEKVMIPAGDRRGFQAAIERALAVDPEVEPANRLANLLAQQKARRLLERIDDLILDAPNESESEESSDATP